MDIFGYAVSLNIRQNDKYTTAIGGSISLLIIAITALFFQTNVVQFFKKVNINSDVSTVFYDDPDQIILEETGMMFAVSILQTNFSTNPYFNVTAEQRSYIRHSDGTKTKIIQLIDLVPCTIDRFQRVFDIQGTNFTDQYNQLGFDTWLCPAYYKYYNQKSRGAQLSMRGLYASSVFDFVKISVTQCINDTANNQNLTWKPICQSQDSIDKYLNRTSSFQIQFYSTDYILNAHQPINYLQMFLNSEIFSTFIPYKMVKYTDIFFKKYNFANDVSLTPIADIQRKSVNIKDINDFRESVEIGNSANTEYAGLYLRCSQFNVNVTRTFQKIGSLLSFLGGFVQFMITIFGVCVKYYNKQWLLVELANQLYDFKTVDKDLINPLQNECFDQQIRNIDIIKHPSVINVQQQEGVKIQLSQQQIRKSCNLESQFNLMNPITSRRVDDIENKVSGNVLSFQGAMTQSLKNNTFVTSQEAIALKFGFKTRMEYLQYQFRNIINNQNSIVLTFRYVVSLLFCGKLFADRQCKLLEKAMYFCLSYHISNKITQDLDVFILLDKINEIDKLKNLLLQKHQIILFNFTPKPNITLEDQKILPSRLAVLTNRSSSFNKTRRKSVNVNDAPKLSVTSGQVIACLDIDHDIKVYQGLQKAYERILYQNVSGDLTQDQIRINHELIRALGAELQNIFYASHLIDFQDDKLAQNPEQIIQPTTRNKAVSPSPIALEIKIQEEPSIKNLIERSSPINDIVQRHLGQKNINTTTQQ